jgi:hypothetical protein
MNGNAPNFRQKIISSLMLVLTVAIVARVAYELLAPLLPLLIVLGCLAVIYAVTFGRFRR